MSQQRKRDAFLQLLREEDLKAVSCSLGVAAATTTAMLSQNACLLAPPGWAAPYALTDGTARRSSDHAVELVQQHLVEPLAQMPLVYGL